MQRLLNGDTETIMNWMS